MTSSSKPSHVALQHQLTELIHVQLAALILVVRVEHVGNLFTYTRISQRQRTVGLR